MKFVLIIHFYDLEYIENVNLIVWQKLLEYYIQFVNINDLFIVIDNPDVLLKYPSFFNLKKRIFIMKNNLLTNQNILENFDNIIKIYQCDCNILILNSFSLFNLQNITFKNLTNKKNNFSEKLCYFYTFINGQKYGGSIKKRYIYSKDDPEIFTLNNFSIDWLKKTNDFNNVDIGFQKRNCKVKIIKLVYNNLNFLKNDNINSNVNDVNNINDANNINNANNFNDVNNFNQLIGNPIITSNSFGQRFITRTYFPWNLFYKYKFNNIHLNPEKIKKEIILHSCSTYLEFEYIPSNNILQKNTLNILLLDFNSDKDIVTINNDFVIINKINFHKIDTLIAENYTNRIKKIKNMNIFDNRIIILISMIGILNRFGGIIFQSSKSKIVNIRNKKTIIPDWMFNCFWFVYENYLYKDISLKVMGGFSQTIFDKILNFVDKCVDNNKQNIYDKLIKHIKKISITELLILSPSFIYGNDSYFLID